MKQTSLLKSLLLLCALVVGSTNVWADDYDVTYNYSDLGSMISGSKEDASSYWRVPASAGNSATIAIPITQQPTGNIKITFSIATYGSGDNPSSSNTTITAVGTETGSNWSGSTVSSYPSSKNYVSGEMTITKPVSPTILGGLTITMGVNSGVKVFRLQSVRIQYEYTAAAVETPTFSPAAGAVEKGTSVTISTSTDGASIYYTTNGTTPTSGSTLYSSALTINSAQTIKAIAIKGGDESTVATAAYTIKKVETPTFSVAEGAVVGGTTVEIETTTDGATIYYTTDGSTPTTSSTEYSSAITIDADMTIKAIAAKTNWDDSDVASATYTYIPPISGLAIDFETNDVSLYTDWDFENIGTHTTTIDANGGDYYGVNVNGSGNATTTAYIKTKNKIANPGTFTCYVSKETNNTTTSTWKIQTSADGSTWTDVQSQDATSMSKGNWTEFSASLTSYSDVYVRLYYTGTNAIRAVDDITLTEVAPVTITAAEYATYCNATKALDFSTTGITVYIATDGETSVALNEVTSGKIPASTPVVLYKAGADGTAINVPVIASADTPAGTNDLHVSTGTDVANMYVLAKKGGVVGFYKWEGTNNLSAGKIYLQAKSSYAPDYLGFDVDGNSDQTTGIDTIEHSTLTIEHSEVYNLNGQRVSQPTKGLYIVNGKKVIVK